MRTRWLLLLLTAILVFPFALTAEPPRPRPDRFQRLVPCGGGSTCTEPGKSCQRLDGVDLCVYTCPAAAGAPPKICQAHQFASPPADPARCACVPRDPQGRGCAADADCGYAPDATAEERAAGAFLCARPQGGGVCLAKGQACASSADCKQGRCDGATRMCVACTPSVGQACNACGGTIQCDGSCSSAAPAAFGQACGCGGSIGCNGACSNPGPANLGQACGACGGTIGCNGACSRPVPAAFGRPCGCGGTIRCDGTCSRAPCPPKRVKLDLTSIDDDAYVWLGRATEPGRAMLRVNTGNVPRAGSLDVTQAFRARGITRGLLTVKIGNGGGFGSQGLIRAFVEGREVLRSQEHDTAWKHTGWTHCVKIDVDITAGTATERCSASCANHLDCHDDCGSQCRGD